MTSNKEYKITIIILNWRGKKDILECLHSLAEVTYNNFEIIIVDNASSDNSLKAIKEFKKTSTLSIDFIINNDNLGFAKANNIGIKKAIENKADYIMLLNNDTVVTNDFLTKINDFINQHPEYEILTPQIRYYEKKDIIWNCGGKINKWGIKKYFFENKKCSVIPAKTFIDVNFITGCAILIKTCIFINYGLLTEDFFFGEEDVEFALRMKKYNIKSACVLNSVIYHKVSSSVSIASNSLSGKIFIHYLNRFINMKKHLSPIKWHLWRYCYIIYIMLLMIFKHKIAISKVFHFVKKLINKSNQLNKVDKLTFDEYFSFNF